MLSAARLGFFCSARLAIELEKKVAKVAARQRGAGPADSEGAVGFAGSTYLLLRAILMNHIAHSEATKVAKGAEQQLRSCLADGDLIRTQEVASLRSDLSRLKSGAVTPTRRQSLSARTSPDGYFSFSSASISVLAHSTSNPGSGASSPASSGRTTPTAGLALASGPGPSPMSFPGSPNGTASASAAAAALQLPASPSPASRAYHDTRAASMMHRAAMLAPAVLAVSFTSSTLSGGRRRGAMTPVSVPSAPRA
ncbi:hypothetical protein DFH11DRAFT_1725324 [Phellopilus nigrolimitatus]|nr:hypothetical protein DFH11DRAFT_1725324 [Phellopilus nigrolimitatus]